MKLRDIDIKLLLDTLLRDLNARRASGRQPADGQSGAGQAAGLTWLRRTVSEIFLTTILTRRLM
ncbi:hypothetical protein [Tropicibacter naphthalenivorans]|uniref:hypothetical protein n=1 Tax=Tropicibacter naphthalenivorans TaxID=441103 RepID=UPI00071D19B4|nr:hypothetical protein [Tropicibacter naphthalenivorans]